MKTGLCTITNTDWPVDDILDLAADVGYDGVEIWGKAHVGKSSPDDDPDLETCRRIANLAAELGLEVPVYGSYLRPGTDRFRDALEPELAAARALDSDAIRIWAGRQEYGTHSPGHWDDVVSDLTLLGDRASNYDIAVTVEKHEGSLTNREEGAKRLIEAVDSSVVGLNWQPLFFLDEGDLLAEAERLEPLANNVHLQATREHGGDRRCPLSEAYFDVAEILDVFHRAGFDGFVEVEFVDPDLKYETAVQNDHECLRRWVS